MDALTHPSSTPSSIAVVGSLMRDIIFGTERVPKLGESVVGTSLTFKHAGKGANIAVAAYRASRAKPHVNRKSPSDKTDDAGEIRVYLSGAVGDDGVGPALRDSYAAQGIDVSGVQILQGQQTGQAAIILDTSAGQASQLGFKGANSLYRLREGEGVEALAGGQGGTRPDVVISHCTLDMTTVRRLMDIASRAGSETILSASPPVTLEPEAYASISHVVFNEHEAAEMSGRQVTELTDVNVAKETAAGFVDLGARSVVITLGAAGAVYATHDGTRGHVPAITDINVRDTTGAGDSFLGAYAANLVSQKQAGARFDIERAIKFATRAASRTIQQIGSQTALPWADEIDSD